MLRVEISFVVKPVNMGIKEDKEVYIINGYEYTKEDLEILEILLIGDGNLP